MPVTLVPPVTTDGESENVESEVADAGVIARAADAVEPFSDAAMFAVCAVATDVVVIVKVACDWPAGTVTVAGTVAAALSLDNATTAPPAGAGPFSRT